MNGRFIAFYLLAVVGAVMPALLRAAPPSHAEWELTFRDEFNGNSVDWTIWESESGPRGADKLEGRWPENNLVKDGILYQITKKENPPRGKRDWSTAHIWTRTFAQQYGYFEARMRYGRYLNNAFWLFRPRGKKFPDPPHFEIDINEGHTPRELAMTLHFSLTPKGETITQGYSTSKKWNAPTDLDKDFHLYAVEWNEEEIIWYFDGQPVRRLKNPNCHAPADVRLSTVIMPRQLERDGVPIETMDGVSMAVDWVRVYQKKRDLRPPSNLPPLEVYQVPTIVERPRQIADTPTNTVLFREDFESVAVGTLPPSWEIGSAKPIVVADAKRKMLKLTPGDYVWRMFDAPVKDVLTVEFDYSTPERQRGLLFVTLGQFDKTNRERRPLSYYTGDVGAYIHWEPRFITFYAEPTKWTPFAYRKPAGWHHARFVLDVSKGVFDYYDTTGFKGGGVFRHRQKAAHGIGLRHHGTAGSVYLDNIVVSR